MHRAFTFISLQSGFVPVEPWQADHVVDAGISRSDSPQMDTAIGPGFKWHTPTDMVGLSVGVRVGLTVGVGVTEGTTVTVGEGWRVGDGVAGMVGVRVAVGVAICVGVGVSVGAVRFTISSIALFDRE